MLDHDSKAAVKIPHRPADAVGFKSGAHVVNPRRARGRVGVIAEHANSGKSVVEFLGPNDQSPDRDKKLKELAGRLE